MRLVLCSDADESALWACSQLESIGVPGMARLSAEALIDPRTVWEHRVGPDGRTATRIRTPGGPVIDSAGVVAVLNRMPVIGGWALPGAASRDREYAAEEWSALVLSWLSSLPHVINPAVPGGLAGEWRPDAHWPWLGVEAGLDVDEPSDAETSRARVGMTTAAAPVTSLLLFRDAIFGPAAPPAHVADGCWTLADRLGTPLLGLDFAVDGSRWRFLRATPTPDLRLGGRGFLAALAAWFDNP